MTAATYQNKNDMDAETEREYLALIYSPGGWFQFKKSLLLILNGDEAILVSFLIGWSSGKCRANARKDGWFYCHWKTLHAELRFSRNKQTTLFKSLETLGIIKTKLMNIPAQRHIWVDLKRMNKLIKEAEQECIDNGEELRFDT